VKEEQNRHRTIDVGPVDPDRLLEKARERLRANARTFEITPHGLSVGEPLTGLQGILKRIPESTD
jgi:hypothetical protein